MTTRNDSRETTFKFCIMTNNLSLTDEPCGVCGQHAVNADIPLEIYWIDENRSVQGIVCEECQEKHAPELREVLRQFYAQEETKPDSVGGL